MYSLMDSTWPESTPASLRTRSKRDARVLRAATRAVSSYDIHNARCRAVVFSKRPPSLAGMCRMRSMRSRYVPA